MKAVFLYTDRSKHMEIENVPKADCKENDALIKVIACAICGTDGRMYEGTKDITKGFFRGAKGHQRKARKRWGLQQVLLVG